MARARNLTDQDVAAIVSILDGCADSLTWDGLIEEIERRLLVRYTRQALHKHARIAEAFASRKKAIRETDFNRTRATSPPELQVARERIARLEAENQRLEMENDRLLEQYVTWIYNANSRGMSVTDLNRPLPAVDRDRTSASQRGRGAIRTNKSLT
jgi:hypothetical protein